MIDRKKKKKLQENKGCKPSEKRNRKWQWKYLAQTEEAMAKFVLDSMKQYYEF